MLFFDLFVDWAFNFKVINRETLRSFFYFRRCLHWFIRTRSFWFFLRFVCLKKLHLIWVKFHICAIVFFYFIFSTFWSLNLQIHSLKAVFAVVTNSRRSMNSARACMHIEVEACQRVFFCIVMLVGRVNIYKISINRALPAWTPCLRLNTIRHHFLSYSWGWVEGRAAIVIIKLVILAVLLVLIFLFFALLKRNFWIDLLFPVLSLLHCLHEPFFFSYIFCLHTQQLLLKSVDKLFVK